VDLEMALMDCGAMPLDCVDLRESGTFVVVDLDVVFEVALEMS